MFELLLSIFCSYRNAQLAKRKGQNTVVWVFITLVAYWICYSFGSALLIVATYKGPFEPKAMVDFIYARPIMPITFMFMGLGGYLIIRYILEKMQDVKSES